jgi:glycosyltransferase involved in cell wall biosynthesis
MKEFRVMQLSTTLQGGAGIAARRTHEALRSVSVNSQLFVLTKDADKQEGVKEISRSKVKKIQSKIVTSFQQKCFQSTEKLITPISINSTFPGLKNKEKFDLIHLHAFYNLLSVPQIAVIANEIYPKKFFVTLHDQRLLTGGCHYSGTCSKFENQCKKCPQSTFLGEPFIRKSHKESIHALSRLHNLVLIAPSQWLVEKAKLSSVTRDLPCHLVRNPVPDCFFNSPVQRTAKSIPNIGFVSLDLNNKWKGLSDFISAINRIGTDYPELKFKLTFVGNGEVYGLIKTIEYEKIFVNSDEDMAKALATIDLVIVPSIEDNLPSVMLEGLASGCQVVGSRTGGITEILEKTGMNTFQPSSHSEIVQALLSFLDKPCVRTKCEFMNQFSYKTVAKSLVDLYFTY